MKENPISFASSQVITALSVYTYVEKGRARSMTISEIGVLQGAQGRKVETSWSIVGEPSGRYLWLLSRTPHPSATTLRHIEEKATAMGYDLSLLRRTAQP